MSDNMLREKIARLIWGMDQDSVERPFERLSELAREDLLDTADLVLALPEIAEALQLVLAIRTMPEGMIVTAASRDWIDNSPLKPSPPA